MSDDPMPLTDTRDMICVHNVFRRALSDAPGQLAGVMDGDTRRAERLATYLGEVLWLLHAHHSGEDELLYPLLVERAPESEDLFSRMDTQHVAVATGVECARQTAEAYAKSGSSHDGQALANACQSVLDQAGTHLTEEELEVLPIASRTITPAEWGALPGHALSQYPGTRMWLLLGLIFEAMPDDMCDHVLSHIPPPVSEMWFEFGSDAFKDEIATIRAGASMVI
jgi:hemerythrin-like domain-containing protein